jgi:hypothetical protein
MNISNLNPGKTWRMYWYLIIFILIQAYWHFLCKLVNESQSDNAIHYCQNSFIPYHSLTKMCSNKCRDINSTYHMFILYQYIYVIVCKTNIVDLHSNVYEPSSHLRDGGGMYSGRLKYNVLKKLDRIDPG